MSLRSVLASGEFVCAPGLADMIAAVIARDMAFPAVYASGYWMGASAFGLPDVGITTYTQMRDRVATLKTMVGDTPVIADADTGYGGLLNVRETVRGFESAGAELIQFEDQEFPKKCGHTRNKRVVSAPQMVKRVQVAVDARTRPDTLIAARSDAYQSEGLDGVMRRLDAYVEAGADVIFPEALASPEEMRKVCETFDVPVMANMADGGTTPILNVATLQEIGFALAIWPALGALSAAAAMRRAFSRLKETGTSIHDDVELYDFNQFCQKIGFEDVWEFERKWIDPDQ
ncbi:MAG: oxaloacetate decarboxylase [Gammaproteobacteria bacterium]